MGKMPEMAYKLIINKISLPLHLFWVANEIFPKCTAVFVITMSFFVNQFHWICKYIFKNPKTVQQVNIELKWVLYLNHTVLRAKLYTRVSWWIFYLG